MPDAPTEEPLGSAESHKRMTALWLLIVPDTLPGRRLRAEFIRTVEPNAAALRVALGVTYDQARGIAAGRRLRPEEAEALAELLHAKWTRQHNARRALQNAARVATDSAATA